MLTTVLYANPVVRLTPLKLLTSAMSLQDLPNLFWRHLKMVVQGVKPFIECLLAQRTEVPLATVRGKAHVYECWGDRRADIP